MSNNNNKQGESHRIYWQQWVANGKGERSRRDLIISSAAVRISDRAKAQDVTDLLRESLRLPNNGGADKQEDCLVLVGTLYSLPKDYVQFEHEATRRHLEADASAGLNDPTAAAASPVSGSHAVRSDPFHVVRTLQSAENPLEVRDRMNLHLQTLLQRAPSASRTIISPKLQWYFVPASADATHAIPNCIDLDGYCTSMEEEDEIEDDDDDTEHDEPDEFDTELTVESLQARFSTLQCDDITPQLSADTDEHELEIAKREDSRFGQLARSQASVESPCMAGYLLKRSHHDPQVWRRVHCVLTDDYLWFVTRVYSNGGNAYAKHGRIRLSRALLLQPTPDYLPLFRTPHSFEVVSARGLSHVFRCTGKRLQALWIKAISERILQSFENSHLLHADMILADECSARSRRIQCYAVEPLWDAFCRLGANPSAQASHLAGAVLRFGLQVADFREMCRYIRSLLPGKSPVVVTTPGRSPSNSEEMRMPEALDPVVQGMVSGLWDQGSSLLALATHVALQIQPTMPSSLETLCRHIEYVLTGRFRRSLSHSTDLPPPERAPTNGATSRHEPPPSDLFDHLLTELQIHAAEASASTTVEATTVNGMDNHCKNSED